MTPSLRLLSFTECAALTGCSVRTIRRWAKAGLFPVTRMTGHPMVREAWLRKAIEQRTNVEGEA